MAGGVTTVPQAHVPVVAVVLVAVVLVHVVVVVLIHVEHKARQVVRNVLPICPGKSQYL